MTLPHLAARARCRRSLGVDNVKDEHIIKLFFNVALDGVYPAPSYANYYKNSHALSRWEGIGPDRIIYEIEDKKISDIHRWVSLMSFPSTKMDLAHRLSGVLGSQRKSFLSYLAQRPSEVLNGHGKLKESPEDPTEEIQVEGHWVPAKKGNPGSLLLKPSDRDKFINWGKKKAKKKIQEGHVTLQQELETLRPQMATAAQQVYDDWNPDKEGLDPVYGEGGPCDEITAALAGVIAGATDVHLDDGGHEGDDHAFLLASRAGERYWVDIPPRVYEEGGGYSWQKIPGIQIKPEDIIIEPI